MSTEKRIGKFLAVWLAMVGLSATAAAQEAGRPLTMDDVLGLQRIERVAVSPAGDTMAVVVQRGAGPGEVYGRTYYDLDPSRAEVWLVSPAGETRNLTQGERNGAGFWCATWSPDEQSLAMLSTRPENGEPRGGDNVRLYIWNRESDELRRVADTAVMTQTRSPLYRLDLRSAAEGAAPRRCHEYENAPFLWIDASRLLVLTLPEGAVSGLIDEYSRPLRHAEATRSVLRDGSAPTATAVESGVEQAAPAQTPQIHLTLFELDSGTSSELGAVPSYPFRGELAVSIAPGGRRAAILAPVSALSANAARGGEWSVEKRLGLIDLASPASQVQWIEPPSEARYPLDLFGWSPDGEQLALRARSTPESSVTPLFVVAARTGTMRRLGGETMSVGGPGAGSGSASDLPVFWADSRRVVARMQPAVAEGSGDGTPARADWWLLSLSGAPVNLTGTAASAPSQLGRSADGSFIAFE